MECPLAPRLRDFGALAVVLAGQAVLDLGADELAIEFSTNLAHWDELGLLAPVDNEWRIDDPMTAPSGSRFYRAIRRQTLAQPRRRPELNGRAG